MSRIKNYVDRDRQEQRAELHILYDRGVSVDVYRQGVPGANPGFANEVGGLVYLRTINVRIDTYDYNQNTDYTHLGLTDDLDVQKDDRWKWTTQTGHVTKLRVIDVKLNNKTVNVRLIDERNSKWS